jgi:hypothetical protein
LLNVAAFCDRLLVADHMSTDGTAEILQELVEELGHLEVTRTSHSAESHSLVEPFAGTDTWILALDGDELYDPKRLPELKAQLEAGVFDDVFRIRPAGLHCDELDESHETAAGYLSPPSRPLLGLLNFAAIRSWRNVRSQRLHGGDVEFRDGYSWDSWRHLGMELGWDASPFRDLHVCFLRRSSLDGEDAAPGRPNLSETQSFRRGRLAPVDRLARRLRGGPRSEGDQSEWKAEKYRRGERVAVDVSAFFGEVS